MLYRRKNAKGEYSPIWWIQIQVGGERINRSSKTEDKKKAREIEAALKKRLYDDLHNGMIGRAPRRTFGEALRRWLTSDAKTLRSYDNLVDKACLIEPWLKDIWLTDVPNETAKMKAAFINQGLEPATINRRLAIVRRVLNLAFSEWGWLDNPLAGKIKLLAEDNERHIYLPMDEVYRLANAAGEIDSVAHDCVLVSACTGLRRGEFLRVTPKHVMNGLIVLETFTKSKKPRVVPIPKEIAHIEFPLEITMSHLRTCWEKARSVCGYPDLHLHDLRHSYAAFLILGGASIVSVQQLLGHANLSVTSRYLHLLSEHLEADVSKAFKKRRVK